VVQKAWEEYSKTDGFLPDVPTISMTRIFNSKKYTPFYNLYFTGAICGSTVTLFSMWKMQQ